jgi:hypothetical protein
MSGCTDAAAMGNGNKSAPTSRKAESTDGRIKYCRAAVEGSFCARDFVISIPGVLMEDRLGPSARVVIKVDGSDRTIEIVAIGDPGN